jgi:hypothetical protein
MTLQAFLIAVLTGSIGLGPIVYYAFDHINWLKTISCERKRIAVAILSGVLGIATWSLAAFLGYVPVPVYRQEYAQAVWQYGILAGYAAFTSSQIAHGRGKQDADPGYVQPK